MKLVKAICLYPPTITKNRRHFKRKMGPRLTKNKLIDMERKFATAGPNKQMYEMYHMSMR